MTRRSRSSRLVLWFALLGLLVPAGCGPAGERPPDVLWIVWDTVRADRMSVYGYEKPTTPNLERWAQDARVFDDCVSAAPYTVPSHGSMFTGLLPSEHGADNARPFLAEELETVAERFSGAGYQTFLFSANPHIAQEENFHQGFDVELHPWDPRFADEALEIVREKTRADRSSELPRRLRAAPRAPWNLKASGTLANRSLGSWLRERDESRPFFAFVNYMEAHRPLVPDREYREAMMSAEQVERSYHIDRSWIPVWAYTFGLHEYDPEQLEVLSGTYDAALLELDALFGALMDDLAEVIDLDRTVVVLTSDHGEHLGEHHLLDHQYSLYDELLRVPLIVRYPPGLDPGRDAGPVVNFDLFPTLLELAGLETPPGQAEGQAVSLLRPQADRKRLAENPAVFTQPFAAIGNRYPGWDPAPWIRVLRAHYRDRHKLIWSSDGRHELFDRVADPREQNDLRDADSRLFREMIDSLEAQVSTLNHPPDAGELPEMGDDMRRRLTALGYVGPSGEGDAAPEEPAWPRLPMPDDR